MRHFRFAYLLALASVPVAGLAQADPHTIDRAIKEGKDHSQVMKTLSHITHEIGPRLTGSPELIKGEKWALSYFKKLGLKNVHLEQWGEVPVGSSRGKLQTAKMVEPFESEIVFTTPSWTNGTNGIVRADAVLGTDKPEEVAGLKDKYAGKWVVVPSTVRRLSKELADAYNALPIAGLIQGSRNELVITSGTWTNKTFENHPGKPQILVRKSDFDRITRNLWFGRKTTLEIGAQNLWQKGPIKQYNVVADLPGTEKPDELVIVSGHFDSWNGPGSEGALDNGTGSSTAIEAARILTKVKAKPKRTIRFILWTGEEQGIYGSSAYVKSHPDQLAKISAVLVDDGGTNYQGGYEGIESQKAIMEAAFAPVVKAFPTMPEAFSVRARMPRGGGSDHAPFNAVGVPGFFTIETGRSDYNFVHHTQHDHYSMAIPEYLVQSATNHAVVSYTLACLPDLLPREPKVSP